MNVRIIAFICVLALSIHCLHFIDDWKWTSVSIDTLPYSVHCFHKIVVVCVSRIPHAIHFYRNDCDAFPLQEWEKRIRKTASDREKTNIVFPKTHTPIKELFYMNEWMNEQKNK